VLLAFIRACCAPWFNQYNLFAMRKSYLFKAGRIRHARGLVVACCFMYLFTGFLWQPAMAQQSTQEPLERCASHLLGNKAIQENRAVLERKQRMQRNIENFIKNKKSLLGNERKHDLIIPVVFHVVYNDSTDANKNISDARILGQLNRLNEDFNRENADRTGVPAEFAGLHANTRIRFALAQRDPLCNPTTGITRTFTTKSVFSISADDVKSSSTGGIDPWPTDEYLNIWICQLPSGLLGYGLFPWLETPATSGVVVAPFTVNNNPANRFTFGRTLVHEVGHYLDIYHIWGDQDNCIASDLVADTPTQFTDYESLTCPTHPQASCGSNDMFMNYMDYVNDACMIMFTHGQSNRMNATLYTSRISLLGSQGHLPPSATGDLWMADSPHDVGNEPNTESPYFWYSEDMWVRKQQDGLTNQEHQNAEYRVPGGPPNYVYVRVRNKSCTTPMTGRVIAYWGKAHASWTDWPTPWDGTGLPGYPGLTLGGPIDTISVTLGADESTILEFEWFPPDPSTFAADFPGDESHLCMIARIETEVPSPFGFTFAETNFVSQNVRNNNNKIQKNVHVFDSLPGTGRIATTLVGNFGVEQTEVVQLMFNPDQEGPNIFELIDVELNLGPELFEIWQQGGGVGQGIEVVNEATIKIMEPGATLYNIQLEPQQLFSVGFKFAPRPGTNFTAVQFPFELDFMQVQQEFKGETPRAGGIRFIFNPNEAAGGQEGEAFAGRGFDINVVPNPFSNTARISYVLPEASTVQLVVYNAMGRQVATLISKDQTAGQHSAVFDGTGLPNGMYFYHLKAGSQQVRGRMMMVE